MLERTLVFAIVVVAGAVFFAPLPGSESASPSAGEATSAVSQKSGTSGPDNSGWFSGDHTLERQADGHFYASALVDGAQTRMLVDTGASVIALTAADADAAGVQWDTGEIRHIGHGANGPIYGVPIQLSEVEIGGMVRRNIDAVIIPEGLRISLLGQSYLAQIGAVEIVDNRMIMRGS
ncbi:MAG: TIGR02281 family clan AA aspartic protease [Pseudomonadota bacterium]